MFEEKQHKIQKKRRNSPDSQKDDDDLVISYEFVLDMVEVEHSETEKKEWKTKLQINNQQLQTIKDKMNFCTWSSFGERLIICY